MKYFTDEPFASGDEIIRTGKDFTDTVIVRKADIDRLLAQAGLKQDMYRPYAAESIYRGITEGWKTTEQYVKGIYTAEHKSWSEGQKRLSAWLDKYDKPEWDGVQGNHFD